jgi:hypothetical protein
MVVGNLLFPEELSVVCWPIDEGSADGGDCGVDEGGQVAFDSNGDGYLDNLNDFAYNGSVTAKITDPDGNEIGDEAGDFLLAYGSDGTLRGIKDAVLIPPELGSGYAHQFLMYGLNSDLGTDYSLKYFDGTSGLVLDIAETITFVSDMTEGNLIFPEYFSVTCWPVGESADDGGGDDGDTNGCGFESNGSSDFDIDENGTLDNYNSYQNNGSITARIYDDVENDIGSSGDYLLAYFNNELRGVGSASYVPPALGGGYAFLTLIYSNESSGETLNFKYYNASSGLIIDLNENEEFISDMIFGNVVSSDPPPGGQHETTIG